jgi:hypothetical protein
MRASLLVLNAQVTMLMPMLALDPWVVLPPLARARRAS